MKRTCGFMRLMIVIVMAMTVGIVVMVMAGLITTINFTSVIFLRLFLDVRVRFGTRGLVKIVGVPMIVVVVMIVIMTFI